MQSVGFQPHRIMEELKGMGIAYVFASGRWAGFRAVGVLPPMAAQSHVPSIGIVPFPSYRRW